MKGRVIERDKQLLFLSPHATTVDLLVMNRAVSGTSCGLWVAVYIQYKWLPRSLFITQEGLTVRGANAFPQISPPVA